LLRPLVLALTVITGFTGLAYEVSWQKYLAILLGAHSEATSAVLGLFLGGLSLGYWLFGALTRSLVTRARTSSRPAPLLRVYGAIEAGIGLYCLVFPGYFELVRRISVWLPVGAGPLAFAVDIALAALLIVPPATLMGGTIPILTQALARSVADATRVHALVYASNTVGAFAGALATGFVLIPWLGLDGILRALGVVNLAAGSLFVMIGMRPREIVELDAGTAAPTPAGAVPYRVAALLVGFAMMVLQTIVIRVGGLALGASDYTFTMVVAVFVLCIALGSGIVSVFTRIGRLALPATLWVLSLLMLGLYFALETSPYWAHRVRVVFRDLDASFYPYYAAVFTGILLVIGPAVVLSGAALPLLFHALRREFGGLGAQAGQLYSVNTVGSLFGALIGGYALLFWLDLHHVYRIGIAAIALAAALITLSEYPRIRYAGAATLLLLVLFAVERLPAWRPDYLMAGTYRFRQPTDWTFAGPSGLLQRQAPGAFPFYDDDPSASVAVQQFGSGRGLSRAIVVNGKSDGETQLDYQTMMMTALVPALLAERASHTFVIGLGTGVTLGALANLEEVESVTVAEISRGVVEAAPFFDFANSRASHNPKIRVVQSDAYRALLKSDRLYDVIISEPSSLWVTGVEQIYAREFLEEVRDRLTPEGVYCQWMHLYETNPEAIELVLKTYAAVFDHVAVWSVNSYDRLLIGFRDPRAALDVERIDQRMHRPDFHAEFARIAIGDLSELFAHETLPLGVVNATAFAGPIHSLYAPQLSYQAGRGFFVGRQGELPFTGYGMAAETGVAHSLLRRYLTARAGDRAELLARAARRACAQEVPGCAALSLSSPAQRTRVEQQRGLAYARRAAALLGEPSDDGLDPLPYGAVLEQHLLYLNEYAHAAPFHPDRLLELWQRCGAIDELSAQECEQGLAVAQRLAEGLAP
jgi:spermidine synthase